MVEAIKDGSWQFGVLGYGGAGFGRDALKFLRAEASVARL
jgi:hypothetical protein